MSPQNDPAEMPPPDKIEMRHNLKRAAIASGVIIGLIILIGVYIRLSQASSVSSWTTEADIPTVSLVSPIASRKNQSLLFPGTLEAFYDANIYARVPGYVHAWYQDIGAHVKKDQLLATIDTPELDQQITQAHADLGAAQAAQKLSDVTARRYQTLLPLDAVSKQDTEDKQEDLESKNGAVKSAQANLDRLQALKGFAQIVAPFDGVVTKRTIDVGALVNAGSPTSPTEPLFAVSDIHVLRLYVNVPQNYSAQIVAGMTVSLSVPEYPGQKFSAKLTSTSNAISSQSTLLVEFEADNSKDLLKPGEYAQVDIGLPNTTSMLRLPASALTFRASGLQVATLGPSNRIVMKPITITTDLGTDVIVGSGLSADDKVVNNPPDSISSGDKVRVETHAH
ncbi:MAG TPA: efflux RND transporter periplasmic adaptor subunit [Rhizomicrobium sp.]|nr:efflux RND transporter periplasmic adaptor subunit [Rhizomicrobium sp.]